MIKKVLFLSLIISIFSIFNVFAGTWYKTASSGQWWYGITDEEYDSMGNINTRATGVDASASPYDFTNIDGSNNTKYFHSGAAYIDGKYYIFDDDGYLPDDAVNGFSNSDALLEYKKRAQRSRRRARGLTMTKGFSTLSDQLGSDISENFDFFGIGIKTRSFVNTEGNDEYIRNDELLERFYTVMEEALYDTTKIKELIDYLKKIFDLQKFKMQEKKYMELKSVAVEAKTQKEYKVKTKIGADLIETIFKCLGLLFVVYGFLIAIAGAVDETGHIDRGLVSLMTAGKLDRDKNPQWNKNGQHDERHAFRISYLFIAFLLMLMGVFCVSTTLRLFVMDKIVMFINFVKGIFIK